MFERIRFLHYALCFERAFRSDDWERVKACFHPEARYVLVGAGPEWSGEVCGPEEIARLFKLTLDEGDRRFDQRRPRLTSWIRLKAGELSFSWKVRYTLADKTTDLTGRCECRFEGGKIIRLADTMIPEEVERWLAMVR